MNLSAPFISRPIATSLLMLALFCAGLLAYQLLPVSSLPEVEYPTMQVLTFYPGASPEIMASSVTAPLERQFGQMPGLEQMTSKSSNGASKITLQFSLGMSLDVAEQEVQAAINAASHFLPNGLPYPPIYSKVNPADTPIMTLALTTETLALTQVEDYAETRLAQKISQLSGVGLVSISGQRPAVRIQANPLALAAYGLSFETIRKAIAEANVNAAKGSFNGPRLAYMINANDQLLTADDYRPLILAYHQGAPVHLSDVAHVIEGVENNQVAAWKNKQPAVIINIQRQPGANVIEVVNRIQQLLPKLQATLPSGITLTILTDRTLTIRAAIHDVKIELLLAILLVVGVIFIFLSNVAATIIPSISVPLSLMGTLAAMYLCGFSLNNLTLMALTIATGFVVDDAIVMIENITRYIEQGDSPFEAALKGSKQIGFTILSLTVSLIAVLIPLLFMQDIVGRLFREFALTLSITIIISAFVSLTLTPMLCAQLLKKYDKESAVFTKKIINNLHEAYRVSLQHVLNHQPVVLIIFCFTFIFTCILFFIIPKGFFPVQDTGVIQGITEASQSISFQAMVLKQQDLARIVLNDPAVDNLSSFIGIDGINTTLNSGRMLITLKPLATRDGNISAVMERLQSQLMKVMDAKLYMQAVQDLTIDTTVSRTQYQYSVNGTDEKEVNYWAQALQKKLSRLNVLRDVASDQQNLGLQTFITIDRSTAARLGITTQLFDEMLYDAFGQRQISTLFTQRNQYHVILETLPDLQKSPTALQNIYMNAPLTTKAIPIATFTQINSQLAPLVINREEQFPVVNLSFNLAPNVALYTAMQAIQKEKDALKMPESIQTQFQGAAKIFEHSLENEIWLVIAAILVVYIVLGVLYESYIHPLTILSTLPSAGMGALLILILGQYHLTVIALIGIILLIGIVMKNAIMMIDFALEQERRYQKSPQEAIFEAAILRFRPILMTTLAALFGAVPLAFGTGMGAELRQPLGLAIIGGLLVSQLLTFYSTPVIYLAFNKLYRQREHE